MYESFVSQQVLIDYLAGDVTTVQDFMNMKAAPFPITEEGIGDLQSLLLPWMRLIIM
jgi:hypothetical protein